MSQSVSHERLRKSILQNMMANDSFDGDLQDSPSHKARCEADSNAARDSMATCLASRFEAAAGNPPGASPEATPEALLMTPADSLVAADAGAEFAKNSAESLVPPDAEELFYESDPEPVKKRPAMKRPAASPAASAAPSAAADAAKPEDKHAAEPEATCDADEPAGESSAAPSKKAKTLFPHADYTYTDKSGDWKARVRDPVFGKSFWFDGNQFPMFPCAH